MHLEHIDPAVLTSEPEFTQEENAKFAELAALEYKAAQIPNWTGSEYIHHVCKKIWRERWLVHVALHERILPQRYFGDTDFLIDYFRCIISDDEWPAELAEQREMLLRRFIGVTIHSRTAMDTEDERAEGVMIGWLSDRGFVVLAQWCPDERTPLTFEQMRLVIAVRRKLRKGIWSPYGVAAIFGLMAMLIVPHDVWQQRAGWNTALGGLILYAVSIVSVGWCFERLRHLGHRLVFLWKHGDIVWAL